MEKTEFSEEDIRRMSNSEVCPPGSPIKTLRIGRPWVEHTGDKVVQHCRIRLDDVEKDVIFEVDESYGRYLCPERADAYVIGLLSLAMRERCDFVCEAPMSAELLHQLETELIPVLVKYSPSLHAPRFEAPVEMEPIPTEGRIATGCSCGIDSLFAIKSLSESPLEGFRLDYVAINNVGAFSWGGQTAMKRYTDNRDNAREFCRSHGLKLVITNSNFADAFPQNHLKTHLYSSTFAIYMLRKLWGRYYYASTGCDLNSYFGLKGHEEYDAAKYDLLALPSFSITGLRICNQGAAFSRFEKTKALADYPPAWEFLSVCLSQGKGHCGRCSKCKRTMWMLDALGKLENFSRVMPVEEYRRRHADYMAELYEAHLSHAPMLDETYEVLRHNIPLRAKLVVRLKRGLRKMEYALGLTLRHLGLRG